MSGQRRPLNLKLPFGVDSHGQLVSITQVDRGIACHCRCQHCDGALVARKGRERVHHFAHANGAECQHALESTLHRLAKELLAEAGYLRIPGCVHQLSQTVVDEHPLAADPVQVSLSQEIMRERVLPLSEVRLECCLGEVVPDVVAVVEKPGRYRQELLLEVRVRHRVDKDKLDKLRRLGLPALELNLSGFDPWTLGDVALIRRALLDRIEDKDWLFLPKMLEVEAEFKNEVEKAKAQLQARRRIPLPPSTRTSSSAARRIFFTPKNPEGGGDSGWWYHNLAAEDFFAAHGRWPDGAESAALARSVEQGTWRPLSSRYRRSAKRFRSYEDWNSQQPPGDDYRRKKYGE